MEIFSLPFIFKQTTNLVTISKYLENILLVVPMFILQSVFYDKFSYVVFI